MVASPCRMAVRDGLAQILIIQSCARHTGLMRRQLFNNIDMNIYQLQQFNKQSSTLKAAVNQAEG